MSDPELKDTQPTPAATRGEPNPEIPSGKKRFPGWLAVFVFVVLVAIGLLAGYGSGMGKRYTAQDTQVTGQLLDQFQLGVQAADAGQYEVAKLHFESVIQKDPNFPGVKAAYADLLIHMQTTPTLTLTPTPTITPTPDLRSAEEQFQNAQDLLKAGDWDGTISKLDSLRKIGPTYQTAQVDGMYYIALRQRGISKILAQTCADINLEGGIYDLTLAERFGPPTQPLDGYADGLRTYARLYITGSSFWDQDWVQAKNYFALVIAGYPSLMDSSCDTATERWRQATIGYADQLAAKGDFCGAEDQYNSAFTVNSPKNAAIFPTATAVQDQCNGGGGGGGDTPVIATATPGGETPTLTPEPPTLTPAPPTETPTSG